MKRIFLIAIITLFSLSLISATTGDVAYIYKKDLAIDQNIVGTFQEMGLEVDMISNKELKTADLSEYDLIFIGDERISNLKYISLAEKPLIITNKYYTKYFGFIDKGSAGQLASNYPLTVFSPSEVQVYTASEASPGKVNLHYYYIPEKYKNENVLSVATTLVNYGRDSVDVVAYLDEEGSKKCFFGIIKTEFWTDEAKEMFEDCVNFALGEEIEPPTGEGHDIEIVEDYTNSVNGIRIKDVEADVYLLDSLSVLECGKQYKVDYKTMNLGEFTEDIELSGMLGSFNWSTIKEDLAPGSYTTAGSKTITIDLTPGNYTLDITANLVGVTDDDLSNNERTRNVFVSCGDVEPPIVEEGWYCDDTGETRDDCVAISSGLGTRCYLVEAGVSPWQTCSTGWIEL